MGFTIKLRENKFKMLLLPPPPPES